MTSFELGYKGTVFEGHTQIAVNAFFYDYEDMQAIFGVGPRVIVDNVGQTDNWRISGFVENVFDGVWYDGNYADDPSPFYIYSQHAFAPSRPPGTVHVR